MAAPYLRDYFAAVNHINHMKIALTAFLEKNQLDSLNILKEHNINMES